MKETIILNLWETKLSLLNEKDGYLANVSGRGMGVYISPTDLGRD